jgi:hypothetical protein
MAGGLPRSPRLGNPPEPLVRLSPRSRESGRPIGEIPDPSCVSSSTRWRGKITGARYAITSRCRVSQDYWTYVNRRVNARGLGFFDIEHG